MSSPTGRATCFAGGLRTGSIHRIAVDDSGNATELGTIEVNQRVRDVRQGTGWVTVRADR